MKRSTLSVFEHQTIHVGRELSVAQFDALARLNDRAPEKPFEVGHRRITFRQFVGYLQVGDLGIEVLPEADRRASSGAIGTWHAFLLEMLRAATGLRLRAASPASQRLSHATLLDVLALEFAEEVTGLVRTGLAKGYRTDEGNSAAFRGKLLVAENIRTNLGRAERTYARFSIFDSETRINRVLVASLNSLANLTLSLDVSDAVRRARTAMPSLTPWPVVRGIFDRLKLDRSTVRYSNALLLARMILERQMPQLRHGETRVFSLMFDMNILWERFVVAAMRRAARGTPVEIDAQSTRTFWRAAGVMPRTIRPDIILRDKRQPSVVAGIVDTKWKLLDSSGPKVSDLHQMFVYNRVCGTERATLLYPATGSPQRITGSFEQGGRCDAVELALTDASGVVAPAAIAEQMSRLFGISADQGIQAPSSRQFHGLDPRPERSGVR